MASPLTNVAGRYIIASNKIETVEAEIKTPQRAQRVREAGIRIVSRTLNGPLRAQSKAGAAGDRDAEYSATCGIRQLPGICWYPAKRAARAANQGGTAVFGFPTRP